MEFYRRKLPHWQISGAEYFVTIRLAGTLPGQVIQELKELRKKVVKIDAEKIPVSNQDKLKRNIESKFFKKYEELLDQATTGPTWLRENGVAEIVKEALHFRDNEVYELYAYCIMSNHVHIVFRHLDNESLSGKNNNHKELLPVTQLLKNLKSFTGLEANRRLNRTGSFWQEESYDRLIRNEKELENVILYTINNPVKANLVSNWKEWPHTFCKT